MVGILRWPGYNVIMSTECYDFPQLLNHSATIFFHRHSSLRYETKLKRRQGLYNNRDHVNKGGISLNELYQVCFIERVHIIRSISIHLPLGYYTKKNYSDINFILVAKVIEIYNPIIFFLFNIFPVISVFFFYKETLPV